MEIGYVRLWAVSSQQPESGLELRAGNCALLGVEMNRRRRMDSSREGARKIILEKSQAGF